MRAGLGLAVLVAVSIFHSNASLFDSLPDEMVVEILDRISFPDQIGLVCRRFRRLAGRPSIAMLHLLHAPISDTDLRTWVTQLASDLGADQSLRRYLTCQWAAGLFDRLMKSEELTRDAKIDTLLILIDDVDADIFLGLALHDADVLQHPEIRQRFLQWKTPVQAGTFVDVPEEIRAYLQQDSSDFHSSEIAGRFDQQLVDSVRSRCPLPFNVIFPFPREASYGLADRLRDMPELLADASLIQVLFRNGIRLPIRCYTRDPGAFPPAIIPVVFPLLDSGDLLSVVASFADRGYDHHASAMSSIPRVRQLIRARVAQRNHRTHQPLVDLNRRIGTTGRDDTPMPFVAAVPTVEMPSTGQPRRPICIQSSRRQICMTSAATSLDSRPYPAATATPLTRIC